MEKNFQIKVKGSNAYINCVKTWLENLCYVEIVKEYCNCKKSNGWYIKDHLITCKDCNHPFNLLKIRKEKKDNKFVEYLNDTKEA